MSEEPPNTRLETMAGERTRLAAERTFSAWIRTGLAGVGGGLAIIHLFFFQNVYHRMAARILGQLLIVWGGLLFLYAIYGYRDVVRHLGKGYFGPSRNLVMGLIAISLFFIALSFFIFNLKY